MSLFTSRMIRAARLDASLYEEVEADPSALGQAMGVVVLSSIAGGIGVYSSVPRFSALVAGIIAALAGWFIWACITYFIGTRLLPEPQTRADIGELLRTIGFSSSPGLLQVFGIIPVLGGLILAVSAVWMLVAMIVAVRQALDYSSTLRAVGVCLVGWLVEAAVMALVTFVLQ